MRARVGALPLPVEWLLFGGISLLLLALPARDLLEAALRPGVNGYGGVDYSLYMDASRRWLAGGPFYEPYQLAGPYAISAGDILYPPIALVLFVPFTWLPAVLWWVTPIAVTVVAVGFLRPSPVTWPFMALCLAWPPTLVKVVTGNPVMWVVAAMSIGVIYRWPSVLALIKPSLFPFALFGIRSRSWWITMATFAAVCIPFGTLWLDWLRTLANSQGGGLAYSVQEIPMVMLPVIAWAGRTRHVERKG